MKRSSEKYIKAIRETCVAGRTIDVTLKLSSGVHTHKRKPKKNITREAVQANNDRRAEKDLTRLLNANFREDDFHAVLTYKEAPTQAQAKKDRENFLRRLRRLNPDLKHIAVTEWEHTRIHHHLVLHGSGLTLSQITELWEDKGYVKASLLDETGEYSDLASYLIKETSKTFRRSDSCFKRRFTCSRNLIRPVVKREKITLSELLDETDPEPISGYYIPKETIRRYEHPVTGIEHLEYIMVALYEPRKYKAWPKGKPIKRPEYYKVNYEEHQEGMLEDMFDLMEF